MTEKLKILLSIPSLCINILKLIKILSNGLHFLKIIYSHYSISPSQLMIKIYIISAFSSINYIISPHKILKMIHIKTLSHSVKNIKNSSYIKIKLILIPKNILIILPKLISISVSYSNILHILNKKILISPKMIITSKLNSKKPKKNTTNIKANILKLNPKLKLIIIYKKIAEICFTYPI